MKLYTDIIVNKNVTTLAKNIRNKYINILEMHQLLYLLARLGDFLTNYNETGLFSNALNCFFFLRGRSFWS